MFRAQEVYMNAAHLHLMVNHAGLFAALFGGLLLAAGMYRALPSLTRAGLVLAIVAGISSIVAVQTGERAEGIVEEMPGVAMQAVEAHEEAAEIAQFASIVLAVLAGAALALTKRAPAMSRIAVIGSLFAAAAVFGLTAQAANLGGRIRHSEVAPPTLVAPPDLAHTDEGVSID
jgi:hypothetical protein